MKRVEQSDIIFILDEKLIYTDDFVIKFYTVNVEDSFIRKTQADIVETDGKKCIKLDWKELVYIGEGVMNYQAWNNIPDSEFPDSKYNKCVDRTTQYYINSNVIVDPSTDKSIGELVEAIEEDLQDEVTRATNRENEIEETLDDKIEAETARATARENTIDQKFANYIPTSQKGSNNGVASLNSNGRVPEGQLQFPTRGQIPSNIDDTNLDNGIYNVNGKVISSEILGGEQANGVFIQYPYGSKVQQLIVGRAANASAGEQVATYTRRYLSTPKRWTEWYSGATPSYSDSYTLSKTDNLIQLKKNGVTINSVVDSDTTYHAMTLELAISGDTDAEMTISPNVLRSGVTKISSETIGEHFLSISGAPFGSGNVQFFVSGDVYTMIDDFLEKSVYSGGGYENSVQVRLGTGKDYLVMALSQREEDQYTFTCIRPSDKTLHWLRIPKNPLTPEYQILPL